MGNRQTFLFIYLRLWYIHKKINDFVRLLETEANLKKRQKKTKHASFMNIHSFRLTTLSPFLTINNWKVCFNLLIFLTLVDNLYINVNGLNFNLQQSGAQYPLHHLPRLLLLSLRRRLTRQSLLHNPMEVSFNQRDTMVFF